jgi:hypothetical protein
MNEKVDNIFFTTQYAVLLWHTGYMLTIVIEPGEVHMSHEAIKVIK